MKRPSKIARGNILFKKMELEIIKLICRQYSNIEMAEKLGISKRSVEAHRVQVLEKIKAKNSVGIVIFAVKHGLFKIAVKD